MDNSTDFKIGDWVVYLPEPEKTYEIVATSSIPYKINDDNFPNTFSPAPGYDYLLKRGTWGAETFQGLEPYKSANKNQLKLKK